MRLLKHLALPAAILLAAPAAAELPVSPLGEIYESYNDCFKVASKAGFKPEALGPLGWSRGTMTRNGKPIAGAPNIFGHSTRKPIIFLSAEKAGGVCTVMARLDKAERFAEFIKAWDGKLPAPDKDGIIGFMVEGQMVALRQTGTADKPALALSVMTPVEKK